ncbi:MAG: carbon monoxide dehydrogenase subunit G [Novosphingobium sp.]|nr:carbon monoxide dehydrogenase subunit G [Novosphingobium sp.]
MQMAGEQRIAAPRQRVWEALNDPEVLRQCIPGCQSLEKEADDRFNAIAEVKIGPIGARFKGAVQLKDLDPANGYTIVGQGNGGIAGSAKGAAKVRLSDDGAGTLVSYDVDAEVGGRMAQLGGPIIDATAKQLAGKFFSKFGEVVGGEVAATAATPVVAAAPAAAAAPAPAAAPAYAPAPAAEARFPWALVVSVIVAVLGGFLLGRSEAADWWVVAMIVLAVVTMGAGYEAGRKGARP